MSPAQELMPSAVAAVRDLLASLGEVDGATPTPCTDFDFETLTNHVVGTTGAMVRVGRGESLDAKDPWGSATRAWPGWRDGLDANLDALARAWSRPQAWEGMVDAGGSQMPAAVIGEMAYVEVLLHGWDLARSAGRTLSVPGPEAAELKRIAAETAELGRQMGAYGEEVPVPVRADDFARGLGIVGRDPAWQPPAAGS